MVSMGEWLASSIWDQGVAEFKTAGTEILSEHSDSLRRDFLNYFHIVLI